MNRPSTRTNLYATVAALLALALGALLGAAPATSQEPSVVKRIELFAQSSGPAAWSPRGDKIAFSRREANGYMQLYVASADMSNARCLTCRIYGLKKMHIGSPAWHPSGEFVVVVVSKPVKTSGEPLRFLEVPGANLGSDLYAIRIDDQNFWNLTVLSDRGGRVLPPHISHEGNRITWAERVSSGKGVFGKWVLRVAKLELQRKVPRLKSLDTHRPGDSRLFYDSHGFTTDDQGLVFSGNLEEDQPESGMDIYRLGLDSGQLRRLTQSWEEFDRFALPAPNGNWIAWTSSRGVGSGRVSLERRQVSAVRAADLWLMNAEGLSAQRLTRFNDVHSPHFAGRTMVIPTSWNRDGDRLLVLALAVGSNEPGDLYVVEFNEPIGR